MFLEYVYITRESSWNVQISFIRIAGPLEVINFWWQEYNFVSVNEVLQEINIPFVNILNMT